MAYQKKKCPHGWKTTIDELITDMVFFSSTGECPECRAEAKQAEIARKAALSPQTRNAETVATIIAGVFAFVVAVVIIILYFHYK
jgi:type IV secretory pathway VirB2 component (pilin)